MAGRAQLLAALEDRLTRFIKAGDASALLDPAVDDEASQLRDYLQADATDRPARQVLGLLHWFRYQVRPEGDDGESDLGVATMLFAPIFISGIGEVPAALRPRLAEMTRVLAADGLLAAAHRAADNDVASAAVSMWWRIVDALSDYPDRGALLSNLGMALHAKFDQVPTLANLDALVDVRRQAVEATPPAHPDRSRRLDRLASTLGIRSGLAGAMADLDQAIRAGREAVKAAPHDDAAELAAARGVLAGLLVQRYRATGNLADLNDAVEQARNAADLMPATDPHRKYALATLATTLTERFQRMGELVDLEAAIQAARHALDATSADETDHWSFLAALASSLQARFWRTGDLEDLSSATDAAQAAVEATIPGHPNHTECLHNLGVMLMASFERTGKLPDLDRAIRVLEESADASVVASRPGSLAALGKALQLRAKRTANSADLVRALELLQEAVSACRQGDPKRAEYLVDWATALGSRFEQTGALADLDAAIQKARTAVDAIPAGHPGRAPALGVLCGALLSRFDHAGARADLDAGIEAAQSALDAWPADHADRAVALDGLARALLMRFDLSGDLADLDMVVDRYQESVDATPRGHPDHALSLSSLGNALRIRFERTGSTADLDNAIKAGRGAVQETALDHPARAMRLSNLGLAIRSKFDQTHERSDLDLSIEMARAAAEAIPAGHPYQGRYTANLGTFLGDRFDLFGDSDDRDAGLSALAEAAEMNWEAPAIRVRAARAAAWLAAKSDPGRASDLLERAVVLLGEMAPVHLTRSDLQRALRQTGPLAAHAAALALADPRAADRADSAARAMRLLEAARGVMMSQVLARRDDLTELRQQHPHLFRRFTDLRDRLGGEENEGPEPRRGTTATAPGSQADERRRLGSAFADTLAEIRTQEGFTSFGLPPTEHELLAQAVPGPVVALTVSDFGAGSLGGNWHADALMLTTAGISSISLPDLTPSALQMQVDSFQAALDEATDTSADQAARAAAEHRIGDVLQWLWDAVAGPVLDELGFRHAPAASHAWPRIWWIPTGILGLLPIHAAGHHSEAAASGTDPRTVMDRVISSYTPTIRGLRYARHQQDRREHRSERALIVAMPTTPGLPRGNLPNVLPEANNVSAQFPHHILLIEPGDHHAHATNKIPTRATVLAHLPGCSVAHFSCHAMTDPHDPSRSQLLLHDHDSTPLTVASLADVNCDQLELAYLSACRTAYTPDLRLIDEAIHLTSAFQLTGAPHVIGTFWEVGDKTAAAMADSFYSKCRTEDGHFDSDRAALALHMAVRVAREAWPGMPSRWAAYMHAGA